FEDGTADFRLMDRVVVDALKQFSERWIFYRGLVQWTGFRRTAVTYDAPERFAGSSSYTLARMLRLGLDAVFAFSLMPLRLAYLRLPGAESQASGQREVSLAGDRLGARATDLRAGRAAAGQPAQGLDGAALAQDAAGGRKPLAPEPPLPLVGEGAGG